MKWKKYSDELPRKEHGWVLVKPVERQSANDAFPWEWHPHDHGIEPCAREWLDHLDDSDDRWIPVSERTPTKDDGEYVLAVGLNDHGEVSIPSVVKHDSHYILGHVACWSPVAWRRLPAPYVPPEPPLWESEEDQLHVVDAVMESIRSVASVFHDDIDDLQRELRKRGYAIRKLEGE